MEEMEVITYLSNILLAPYEIRYKYKLKSFITIITIPMLLLHDVRTPIVWQPQCQEINSGESGYNTWVHEHYNDVIMSEMASQITSLTIVYSTVYSGLDQRKYQSSASLASVRGIHRSPVNSLHKVTRKMFPFDDVIMNVLKLTISPQQNKQNKTVKQKRCNSIANALESFMH